MLDYIKKQLEAQQPVTFEESDVNQEISDNELISEYASIFQELDDITVEGLDADKPRPMELDIPIEDDIELDTVEFNLMDGRLVDVPMDATLNTESFVENMKTFEDFYQEACEYINQFPRESEESVHQRRSEYARNHYDKYHEEMVQEGLFGFEQLSIYDNTVPSIVMENFGIMDESNPNQKYMVKLPVMFEMTKHDTIYQSQIDALRVAHQNAVCEQFGDLLREKTKRDNIWDYITPTKIIIPKTRDNYELIVEFMIDEDTEPFYEGWSYKRKPSERGLDVHEYPREDLETIVKKIQIGNKRERVVQESTRPRVIPDRWNLNELDGYYQEAIDFGYPDETTEAANKNQPADAPSVNNDPSTPSVTNDAPPEINDANAQNNTQTDEISDTSPDVNVDNMDQPTPDQADKTPVDTNDVSDQIADNVSDQTMQQNDDTNGGIDNIDLDDYATSDMNSNTNSMDDIDNSLNDLDTSTGMDGNDTQMGDPSNMNIDTMSIDDIMAQASDKLKSIPIEQVKQFLTDGTSGIDNSSSNNMGSTPSMDNAQQTTEYYQYQESATTSYRSMLSNEIIYLLGILNSRKPLDQLVASFKSFGKQVGSKLIGASRYSREFTSSEIQLLSTLNTRLNNLMIAFKPTSNKQESDHIKALISDFTSQAKKVLKILSNKEG